VPLCYVKNQKGKCVPPPQSATATGLGGTGAFACQPTSGDAWSFKNRPHPSPDFTKSLQPAANKSLTSAQNNAHTNDADRPIPEAAWERRMQPHAPPDFHGPPQPKATKGITPTLPPPPTRSAATRSPFLRTFLSLAVSKSATVLISCWLRLHLKCGPREAGIAPRSVRLWFRCAIGSFY